MRTGEAFQPRLFSRAVYPCVERGACAGNQVRLLVAAQIVFRYMGFAHARVVDQLVFLVLPDSAFDVERPFGSNSCPTITPVVSEEGHVQASECQPRGGKWND